MNKEVFIIGGGESLIGFDFQKLSNLTTIAVNRAALDVPNPTYSITADSNTFQKIQDGVFNNVNTTWVLVTNPDHCTMKFKNGLFKNIRTNYVYNLFSVNMVIKNAGTDGIGFDFKDFRTGYNSGFCAFQLAVLLGYTKIYLLGFDLNKGGHYYNKNLIDKISLDRFYNNFILAFEMLKHQRPDIEIYSCSSTSRLNKHIPYIAFDSIKMQEQPVQSLQPEQKQIYDSDKKLSVLICSLHKRKALLKRLLDILNKQKTDEIEILVDCDDGIITTGEKRNKLLHKAKGDYVTFIDDDDVVSNDYISKILKAVKSNPDCCGIEGEVIFTLKNRKKKFIHSIKYNHWFEENGVYYRCPNHISPVKRSLALKAGFPNINREEDKAYSLRLRPYLKTEKRIEGVIYHYITT